MLFFEFIYKIINNEKGNAGSHGEMKIIIIKHVPVWHFYNTAY